MLFLPLTGKFSASGSSSFEGCESCGEGSYSAAGAVYCSVAGAGDLYRISMDLVSRNALRVNILLSVE
jgi:hypothetical protein